MANSNSAPKSLVNPSECSENVANVAKSAFTERYIESLPAPKERETRHFDPKTRALCVVVSPAGVKSFWVYRRFQGKPRRWKLGRFPELKLDKARRMAEGYNAKISAGIDPEIPEADGTSYGDRTTFEQLFKKFMAEYVEPLLRPHTVKNYRSLYSKHLSELSARKLSTIKRSDVASLHARIGAEHPHSANRCVELVSSCYTRANSHFGWEDDSYANPADGVKAFRELKRERYLQDDEEVRCFMQALSEEEAIYRDFFALCLLTGARRGCVQSMTWAEINFTSATWVIPSSKSKSGIPMTVPLVPGAVSILKSRLENSAGDYVFPANGRGPHVKAEGHLAEPKFSWRRIVKRAAEIERADWIKAHPRTNLKHFQAHDFSTLRIHDLRRTLASWQARQGTSLQVVGKSLGHQSSQSTEVYSRLDLVPVRNSMTSATDALLAAAGQLALAGKED